MSLARLLTLPTEIRALIFEHVVTEDQLVTFRLEPFQKDYYTSATQPALTRVSRQMRSESLPFWYECNNFVLHTEGRKADDGRKWLLCNAHHLDSVKRFSFWIRYVPLVNQRASSQGAISVSIYRQTKHACWHIDPTWLWITVVRKPVELAGDAKFLMEKLASIVPALSSDDALPDDYFGAMSDLRLYYVQEKTS
ncbi:hypothetical protein CB0940_00802 [Cercospora beticola]|uniref:2EXR domain-containing protein n=1 Tax=Cercospora beticola TaxID=122368 RepID=A0A2G5I936_CERBT|nr:hypothetical protein CB0940_00802 [Cercospora beticola]PIB01280.1 hypothetical protein CB0940_00802 [Cercospora beticola]WPA96230.1 hypothetical protein RHO25_000836 [Cercospora beticola]CAK1355479.1 unnamed protein product [Cercospora beticola]